MKESKKYVRIYTTYADGSFTDTDVFYESDSTLKALQKFKEDFPQAPNITITAVPFDLSKVSAAQKRAFNAAEKAGAVYEL